MNSRYASKMKHTKKFLVIALFAVFLFLRLFTDSSYTVVGGDYVKYLLMAKNFPYHTTMNNQMAANHGPFFPYAIYFFTLVFQEDHIAAFFISLLSAAITFFILYNLFMMLTNNFYVTFTVLLLFTLSVEFISTFETGLKESFVVMLIISSIFYYIKGVKFNNKKSIIVASIFGGLTAITADQVIFLFPIFILAYLFFNYEKINLRTFSFPGLKYAIIPIIVTFLFYASWTGIKVYQYSTNEYYPNSGVDGDPVSTEDFGLMELLNPRYFDDTDPALPAAFSFRIRDYAFGLGYMFNTVPFGIPRGLNFSNFERLLYPSHVVYMILIYLPLALVALFVFISILKDLVKRKHIYNNVPLFVLLIFLIFLFPLTQQKTSLRYFYTSFIFLYFFIGSGLFILFKKCKIDEKFSKLRVRSMAVVIITIMFLLLTSYWYYQNDNLALFSKKYTLYSNTAEFINNNIGKDQGIMVQAGYNYNLQYSTNRRIVGIPPEHENLLTLIDYYNVNYIVYGDFITDYYHYTEDSIEYIEDHPEKFELISSIKEEDNPELKVHSDELYIYKIIKSEEKLKKEWVIVI